MRRALVEAILAALFSSCANTQNGSVLVDGRRRDLSPAEIANIVAVSQRYIDSPESFLKGGVYLVHIVSQNKVQVYFGEHLHAGPVGPEQYLELERTHASWRITHNYLAW
jgi:hypothetical protein